VQDVNRLLKQFQEMQRMMKQMKAGSSPMMEASPRRPRSQGR